MMLLRELSVLTCQCPLAHLLKNRFSVGEIAYRDEVHQGEHEPILDRALFEAVQARLHARPTTSTA